MDFQHQQDDGRLEGDNSEELEEDELSLQYI